MNTLAKQRRAKNLSQRQLAKLVGISPGMIALIEVGHRKPSLSVAFKIAKKLNTTVDDLFGSQFEDTTDSKKPAAV